MKQYIGLYAVGFYDYTSLNKTSNTIVEAVLLRSVAKDKGVYQTMGLTVLKMLKFKQPGLYVGIINIDENDNTTVINIVPLKTKYIKNIDSMVKPELSEQCIRSIDSFIDDDNEDGEPTPAYVDQDPT